MANRCFLRAPGSLSMLPPSALNTPPFSASSTSVFSPRVRATATLPGHGLAYGRFASQRARSISRPAGVSISMTAYIGFLGPTT